MKFAIIFAAFFAVASCALLPGSPDSLATVLNQQADIAPDHSSYQYVSQTSNGISAQEQGTLVQARSLDKTAAYVVTGSYSWVAADGQTYTVRYTADENGFHPEGAHLPVAPIA